MAVKPAPGEVLEQTTRTRVLPVKAEDEERVRLLPIWDYVETVPMGDWTSGDYEFTIYRGTKAQKADDKTWIGKFREKITPEVIQSRWGGGDYNVWLKCPPGFQLRYNVDLKIEGSPRSNGNGSYAGPVAGDTTSQLIAMFREEMRGLREELKMARGGDATTRAVEQAVGLSGQVFSTAVQAAQGTLTRIASPGGEAGIASRDPLMEKLLTVAIERLLTAPQPATNSVKDTIEMIGTLKNAGLFGAPEGKTTMALELMRQAPVIANSLVQGMQAWATAEDARARQAAMLRGSAPINVQPLAAAPPNVVTMPAPATPPAPAAAAETPPPQTQVPMEKIPGAQVQPMPVETLEQMIVQIVADESLSVEEAANEACALIERAAPGQTDKLASMGEAWMVNFFSIRPVLSQVAQHPRLPEFVREFIKAVKSAPVVQQPNSNAPVA